MKIQIIAYLFLLLIIRCRKITTVKNIVPPNDPPNQDSSVKDNNDCPPEKSDICSLQLSKDDMLYNDKMLNVLLTSDKIEMNFLIYQQVEGYICPLKICDAKFSNLISWFKKTKVSSIFEGMPGIALICNTQGSLADECTLYFFNKIERFPIDSEFGLLMMLELLYKGNITNKHFFIYEFYSPCMICLNYYDTFLQKYSSVLIDVYFSDYYTIDKTDLLNGIYETSNSRIYGSSPKEWNGECRYFSKIDSKSVPSLQLHLLNID